jgi:DNA-binding XRE family transcriptional regulator
VVLALSRPFSLAQRHRLSGNNLITIVKIVQDKNITSVKKNFSLYFPMKGGNAMGETFGERLTRLRQQAGLQQGRLAAIAGIRQSMLSMLEADQRDGAKIQAITAIRLAEALEVSVEYLITGEERPRRRRRTKAKDADEEAAA